jgi:hypothetical protein
MSATTKVNVDFVTTYNNKGAKQAHDNLEKLTGTFKKLGASIGVAFGGRELLRFSKEAVKAFAADDKSAKILTQTLGNLGQGLQDVPIENFISKLSEVNGIAKTDLRQAFNTLVRSTGDATKAQELLNVGLDVSAGTGKDLEKVAMGLAKAYAGNNASLGRLGLGLTKAQLKTNTFAENMAILVKTFKGDAAVAADSFSGKVNRLTVSFEELKISVGQQLVDALMGAGNGDAIAPLQQSMKQLGQFIGQALAGLVKIGVWMAQNLNLMAAVASIMAGLWAAGKAAAFVGVIMKIVKAFKELEKITLAVAITESFASFGASVAAGTAALATMAVVGTGTFIGIQKMLDQSTAKTGDLEVATYKYADALNNVMGKNPFGGKQWITDQWQAQYKAALLNQVMQKKNQDDLIAKNKQALKLENDKKKAKADQLALDRAALSLKLAGQTTDMNNIEIQAALQRGQTQQVTQVLLLQRAEITQNAAEASILAQEVLKANGLVMDVNGNITSLAKAKNPFSDWPDNSSSAIAQVKALEASYAALLKTIQAAARAAAELAAGNPGGIPLDGSQNTLLPNNQAQIGNTIVDLAQTFPDAFNNGQINSTASNFIPQTQNNQPIVVDGITVQISLDGTPLLSTITNAQVNQSASGTPSTFSRSGYFGP